MMPEGSSPLTVFVGLLVIMENWAFPSENYISSVPLFIALAYYPQLIRARWMTVDYWSFYHNYVHRPLLCPLFDTRRIGDWILSPKRRVLNTWPWIMFRNVIVILIYYRHKPIDLIKCWSSRGGENLVCGILEHEFLWSCIRLLTCRRLFQVKHDIMTLS
jgi:hypothetical protein